MFALRPGRHAELAPIALGSHLDTQPTGGKFDGNLGVLGALEALRTLVAAGYETNAPIVVVNWTNEEGARFAPAMLGSGVFAGVYSRAEADAIADIDGVRFGEALDGIGWRGEVKAGAMPLSAYLELHIEQGPILEAEDKTIGVVTGVQGVRWYEATITGRESHAGTTPMPRRADAFVACARLALEVQTIALAHAPTAVGTVGRVEVEPNSPNVIPGVVRMTVDLRHHDDARAAGHGDEPSCRHRADRARRQGARSRLKKLHDLAAVKFHPDCIAAVRAGAEALGLAHRDIISGAGHDACTCRGHADGHDLRALQGRPEPQRGRERHHRALRRRRPGAAGGGAGAGCQAGRVALTAVIPAGAVVREHDSAEPDHAAGRGSLRPIPESLRCASAFGMTGGGSPAIQIG